MGSGTLTGDGWFVAEAVTGCRGAAALVASACENRGMSSVRLTATLVPRGPAAAVVLEGEQVAAVGEGAKRFPVVAMVNGYTWRTTVTRMRGEFILGLNRAVRQEAGV